jgi:hypothetical protein
MRLLKQQAELAELVLAASTPGKQDSHSPALMMMRSTCRVADVDRSIRAPGPVHLDVVLGQFGRNSLQFGDQALEAAGVLPADQNVIFRAPTRSRKRRSGMGLCTYYRRENPVSKSETLSSNRAENSSFHRGS